MSEIRTQTGNPEAAAEALETALRKLETTQDDLLEARVLSSLAGIYLYDLSDLEAARNTARKGVERTPPVEACVDILRRVLSQKEATNVSAVTFGTPGEARRVARDFELVGDTHNAYLLLEKAGEKFPENTELVEARIDLARMLNDSDRLYRDLTERIDLPISLRRRADIELELGRMCLEWKANPSAALYWFRSAKEKVPSTRADAGIADAARMLQTQAEKLLADGEAEAADMIFEAVQDDAKSIDTYQSRLDEAEAAADAGNWPRAAELARSLSLAPREIRIKAAIVTARVLAAEGRSELAVQLLEGAALGQDEAGKRLLYIGAVRIQPAHLLNPDAVLQFLLRIHREQPHDAAVDDAVIQMYSMTADKVTLAEYLAAPNTPFDKERYRNAARLFEEAGLHERAAAVLERLYRETDAIDDLFLLAEVFSKIGNREVLIGMLEERRNEDPRVDDLLRQELALYSELLNSSLNPDDAFERNVAGTMDPHRTTPNTSGLLLPISNDAPLPELSPDEDSLDEKLSSAFNRLRIKPKE